MRSPNQRSQPRANNTHNNFHSQHSCVSKMTEVQQHKEGGDITASDMIDESNSGTSDLQNFYADSTIFITGATGFLGKILLEKLLRTCSDLKKIYILIRPKKDKDARKRFEDIFEAAVSTILNVSNVRCVILSAFCSVLSR